MSAEVENKGKAKAFVDTNIVLYAFDTSAGGKREEALRVFADLWRTGAGCVSVQVLQEVYVNVTRKLSTPLPTETAEQIVAALSRWEVHAPTAEDVLGAIDLQRQEGAFVLGRHDPHERRQAGLQVDLLRRPKRGPSHRRGAGGQSVC